MIFDFNGTLSDDEPILLRVFAGLFAEHLGWRLTADEYFARFAGLSDREIVETAVAEQAPPDHRSTDGIVERLLRLRREHYLEQVDRACPVREDTQALVRAVAGAGALQAIVTGAQRADVDLVLARSKVADCFDVVVTEEDVHAGKPDPEGYLLGAERLGVGPAGVLVFEDSVAGIRAARSAGMRCVGVVGTHDAATLAAEGVPTVDRLEPGLVSLL